MIFVGVQGRGLPKFWLPVKKKKSQNAESLLERQTPCLEVPLARLEVRVQEEAECSDFGTPEYIII